MNKFKKPLLSICIPTYNRAELLRSSLLSVMPQINVLDGDVEVVVSDNCSTDNTREIVEWARQFGPIKYHCNSENIGAARNLVLAVNELGSGEFSWILGDDDFVRPDGVARVVETINKYPEIDYIFVSLCHITVDQLYKYPAPVSSKDLPDNLPPDNRFREDFYVEKWEELIDPDISGVFLGGIQVSVFRSALWRRASPELSIGKAFSSLAATYPHIMILANCMIGRKAFYIGTPQVVVVNGTRDWWDLVPMIILVRLNEAIDFYERVGIAQEQIERCRKFQMSRSGDAIVKMLLNPRTPGREYVSLRSFFVRYWHYKELWFSLSSAVVKIIVPRKILESMKKFRGK